MGALEDIFNRSRGAILSPCGKYRYKLWRIWDEDRPMVTFIGLNPSRADDMQDDRTLKRCMVFADSWGFGGLYMMNLFAWRTPYSDELLRVSAPVGPETDKYLAEAIGQSEKIVLCYGTKGCWRGRDQEVLKMLTSPAYCLRLTKNGFPEHPLYVKGNTSLILFNQDHSAGRVVHCKQSEYDVYIGRPSKWGNPYSHRHDTKATHIVQTREDAIESFREYIENGEGKHLLKDLHELKGKTLGCYCHPQKCHGDVLIELVKKYCK